ncbi:hypothetical protein N8T08_003238 [Aspergillus melleus]|uniref:Uncharacterized protein n=1 Tax=Aspergillus melleus TaxID=138277 RepID=A0ACC3B7V2_9EURO|nr:hypothetical protein N8T08_003238 [Aspergillus melleus]
MSEQACSRLIDEHPIGHGLDSFRASFNSICAGIGGDLDRLDLEDAQDLTSSLLTALQLLPITRLLRSKSGRSTVRSDLLRLISAVASDGFDFNRIKPLLKVAILVETQDAVIWDLVSSIVVEPTPPRLAASSVEQTPWQHTTSSFVHSSEPRRDVDRILKSELGPLYVGIPNICETFFGSVPDLEATAIEVLRRCTEGEDPLFGGEGWAGWPAEAKESSVLAWFGGLIPKLVAFAEEYHSISTYGRKLLAQPKTPLAGSTGKRSMDIGFVNSQPGEEFTYNWPHILIPGELKSNTAADKASMSWIDLATYAREVLAAQDTRRFVLGFTLCGSFMRVWLFDRLGGIASERFNINKDGSLQFLMSILGFLCMDREELGFDPTIIAMGDERYIEIVRDGQTEELILDEVMKRTRCIAGRATTCWKAHCRGDPYTRLVIKDSWQYTDRDEEGEILQEVTDRAVVNIARYYYHETVQVRGADDDIRNNIRKGLQVVHATNYRQLHSLFLSSTNAANVQQKGRSSSPGMKRPSSEAEAVSPPRSIGGSSFVTTESRSTKQNLERPCLLD